MEHWNGEVNKAVAPQCPNARQINSDLEALYFKYTNALRALDIDGNSLRMSVTELKKHIMTVNTPQSQELFTDYFKRYADTRHTENSRIACTLTLKTILAFCGTMEFADITVVYSHSAGPWNLRI